MIPAGGLNVNAPRNATERLHHRQGIACQVWGKAVRPIQRRLPLVLGIAAAVSMTGCGSLRSLGQRIFHPKRCTSCVSSEPIVTPLVVPGAMVVPGAAPIVAQPPMVIQPGQAIPTPPPPQVSHKPSDEQNYPPETEETPKEEANEPLPPIQHPAPKVAEPESPAPRLEPPPPAPTRPMAPTPAPPPTDARPSGLSVNVSLDKGVVAIGDTVNVDVTVRNQGTSPIEWVEMSATLSPSLRPKAVTPEGTATIQGSVINFRAIKPLQTISLTFRVACEVVSGEGSNGRVALEVRSSALSAGPLKQEAAARITPRG